MISEIKKQVFNDARFSELVEASIKLRQIDLPKAEEEIRSIQKSLSDLENKDQQLSQRLLSAEDLNDNLVKWLSDQVDQLKRDRDIKSTELKRLQERRSAILDESGLRKIHAQVKKALNGFDDLSRVQQRTLLEKIISQIVVKSEKKMEIRILDKKNLSRSSMTQGRFSY